MSPGSIDEKVIAQRARRIRDAIAADEIDRLLERMLQWLRSSEG